MDAEPIEAALRRAWTVRVGRGSALVVFGMTVSAASSLVDVANPGIAATGTALFALATWMLTTEPEAPARWSPWARVCRVFAAVALVLRVVALAQLMAGNSDVMRTLTTIAQRIDGLTLGGCLFYVASLFRAGGDRTCALAATLVATAFTATALGARPLLGFSITALLFACEAVAATVLVVRLRGCLSARGA